uniref:Snake toxin/toxin-like domain-containing protein n=1 Tax=Musca domestica TaxID=7370 RepID=A0A1I8M6K3_MUSDO
MSPAASQRYNEKIATSSGTRGEGAAPAGRTTKTLKLQQNARGIVGSHSAFGRARLSSLVASETVAATTLLSASSNSSLLFEEKKVKSTAIRPTLQQTKTTKTTATAVVATTKTGRRNRFNTATETLNEKNSYRNIKSNNNNNTTTKTTTTSPSPSFKIMSYQRSIFALLAVLLCGLVGVDGLKCHMCGQYNEGVGSITPCLNYSEQHAHLYLKECSKKSEKYCVKYVSELSIVRDCATECSEKEIWETQTYCCTEDGCNGASNMEFSTFVLIVPIVAYMCQAIWNVIKEQKRR